MFDVAEGVRTTVQRRPPSPALRSHVDDDFMRCEQICDERRATHWLGAELMLGGCWADDAELRSSEKVDRRRNLNT